VFAAGEQTGRRAIFTLPLAGGQPSVFLDAPFLEHMPIFAPDGAPVAYASNESGRSEVYVRSYPRREEETGRRVSEGGGTAPVWSWSDGGSRSSGCGHHIWGAMPMCGPLGPAVDFLNNGLFEMLVTFEALFPGTIGSPYEPSLATLGKVKAALTAQPERAAIFGQHFARPVGELPLVLAFFQAIAGELK
jgi:Tol biopolymer transport system component